MPIQSIPRTPKENYSTLGVLPSVTRSARHLLYPVSEGKLCLYPVSEGKFTYESRPTASTALRAVWTDVLRTCFARADRVGYARGLRPGLLRCARGLP